MCPLKLGRFHICWCTVLLELAKHQLSSPWPKNFLGRSSTRKESSNWMLPTKEVSQWSEIKSKSSLRERFLKIQSTNVRQFRFVFWMRQIPWLLMHKLLSDVSSKHIQQTQGSASSATTFPKSSILWHRDAWNSDFHQSASALSKKDSTWSVRKKALPWNPKKFLICWSKSQREIFVEVSIHYKHATPLSRAAHPHFLSKISKKYQVLFQIKSFQQFTARSGQAEGTPISRICHKIWFSTATMSNSLSSKFCNTTKTDLPKKCQTSTRPKLQKSQLRQTSKWYKAATRNSIFCTFWVQSITLLKTIEKYEMRTNERKNK